mmetsp:Transcript_7496/g.18011  ORF Transcript_7496/g.18011 Transcript_7496/m.18011 type:complete len:832 (-) Transcript_7496:1220-3715(-)|eukprot:CAMPEP_0113605526 /NCGR_PEP_ID=MMETSP0017_2-20120614/2374_1 /TAXON_ID=2856 /ORGANISM="Cylindrotheca closterium" /LENGTH=831 /DNA_ID=CAMNT_0000514021 /DNA_START=155 /DNA_END=2650 /DNA_ORIENTATION=+ /assembly_acc=CAM_ASM_000147
MTDGEAGGGSRLDRLRQKHKALLSTSSRKIAQSRGRLGGDFEGTGRKFYFEDNGKKPADGALPATAEGENEAEAPKVHKRSSTSATLKEENKRLREELKESQAEREKLRKNLSNVAVQVQNASKAILSTKVHEANAKLSAMEIDLKETQERLDAKEASQNELLTQMQKLRKENAKLGSQVRLHSHSMSGTKNNKIKELQERVTDLEETNRDLTLEKAKLDAQLKIEQEDGYEGMKKAKKRGDKEASKEEKGLARIRQSNMTMIQTQLAVSSAQLTSAEMELADKEHEISELQRAVDELQKDNNKLRKAKGEMVDPTKVKELEKEVTELESVNQQLVQEKMQLSLGSIEEDLEFETDAASASGGSTGQSVVSAKPKTEKRVRDSNLTMMKTQLALAHAQSSSVEQELADMEHELMDTQLRLDEANKARDHAISEKREAEKKLQEEINKAYKLEKDTHRAVTLSQAPPEQIPTNIAVGVGNGEIGGTFDFGAIANEANADASVKVIHFGGGDDQTAKSAMTGYTDASSMAQTYAVTIVQTKLADSHAKYADLEIKYADLQSAMDTAMVEIGTKQTSAEQQANDLSSARDKNAEYQAEMANLKAQIAVLEDKQIKALKRQMRKARRAEEDGDDEEEEEEEVIPLVEHRSTVAILNTKLQEANVKMSSMEREMDELADMLESTLIDGEGKRAIINSLNEEIAETRRENAELYTQVQENEAMNEVFEGARILELETKLMGLEMMNQNLMLQQLEDEDAANSAVPYNLMEEGEEEEEEGEATGAAGGTKVEKLERKIRGLEQMNKALSNRNLTGGGAEKASSAPDAEAISEDASDSS